MQITESLERQVFDYLSLLRQDGYHLFDSHPYVIDFLSDLDLIVVENSVRVLNIDALCSKYSKSSESNDQHLSDYVPGLMWLPQAEKLLYDLKQKYDPVKKSA